MSQTSIANYFRTRKRTAADDDFQAKNNKVRILDNGAISRENPKLSPGGKTQSLRRLVYDVPTEISSVTARRTAKPTRSTKIVKKSKPTEVISNKNLVAFIRKGLLSPNKPTKIASPSKTNYGREVEGFPETVTPSNGAQDNEKLIEAQLGMKTPVKHVPKTPTASTSKASDLATMPLDQVKRKLNMSDRLTELKTRINTLQQGFDKADRLEQKRNKMATPKKTVELSKEILGTSPTLKKFDKMEVEVRR